MRRESFPEVLFILSVIFLITSSCKQDPSSADKESSDKIKLEKLKLAEGFHAEHLYSPSANEQGSWVSMTFDDKGRLITSDQYGAYIAWKFRPLGVEHLQK